MGLRTRICPFLLVVAGLPAVLVSTDSLSAADWNRFRGPDGQGQTDAIAAREWSLDQGIVWKCELPGKGTSSPILIGDRVFLTCWSGSTESDASRHMVCVDRSTGKILWDKTLPLGQREDEFKGYLREHGYTSATPVSDGINVYGFFGKAGVAAWTLDGEQLWHQSVGEMSSARKWGSASSPVLFGDILIVNAAEEGRAVLGLSTKDGSEVWKAQSDDLELCFGTPLLTQTDDGTTESVLTMAGKVWALDPQNGELRWEVDLDTTGNVSPSAVLGADVIYTFGGFPKAQTTAIRRGGHGNITDSHIAWTARATTSVPTPVLVDGHLIWVSTKGQAFVLNAKSGEIKERRRLENLKSGGRAVYASPVRAGNYVYVVTRRSGTFVFDANADFTQVAQNPALDETDFNATPAIADGQLFLRSDEALYCIQ